MLANKAGGGALPGREVVTPALLTTHRALKERTSCASWTLLVYMLFLSPQCKSP